MPEGPGSNIPVKLAPKAETDMLIALFRQGRLPEAAMRSRELCKRHPGDAFVFNLAGVISARAGRLEEALRCYRRAIEIKADYDEAHNNCGNVLNKLGRPTEALASFAEALRINPDFAEANNNSGDVLRRQGKYDEAAARFARALQIRPDYAEACNNLGNVLVDLGRPREALDQFNAALRIDPGFVQVYYNQGETLRSLGRTDEAIHCFEAAIKLRPDYAQAYNSLGATLNDKGHHRKAIETISKAIQLSPTLASAHNNLGNALSDQGLHEEAMESYLTALKINPDFAEVHSNLGNSLYELGRYDEAVARYNRALELKPDFAEAHNNLSRLKSYSSDDPQIAIMEKRLTVPGLPANELIHLNFALGKVYEDLRDVDRAFAYISQGNQLRKSSFGYDINADRMLFNRLKSVFQAKNTPQLEQTAGTRTFTRQPIFIVGMPRSGTSLTEQILASHSQVFGGGELEALGRILDPVLQEMMADGDARLDARKLARLRDTYLEELQGLPATAPFITDKMPQNFRWIGFLAQAMPGVKIIHMQREPAASCWSMFKMQFGSHGYTNDMLDLGEYYKLYLDLMEFWRREYPGQVYDLDYQALTENQERETRKLLEYCGLDWEDQCLEFYKTERAVKTPSGKQVRQKMYTGSSEAWKKYAQHLQPLLDALNSRD